MLLLREEPSAQSDALPQVQRFIVRIIFMVPVYAVSSFCSLIFPHGAIYFDTVRIWCALASLCSNLGQPAIPCQTLPVTVRNFDVPSCMRWHAGLTCFAVLRPRSYEAFVIYNFLSLCLSYVGGPGAVEVQMNGYLLMPSWWNCTCCLPPQVSISFLTPT